MYKLVNDIIVVYNVSIFF